MQIGLASRALDGKHCGDQCAYWRVDHRMVLCMVDGLGHGEFAEAAAKAALTYVAQHLDESLEAIFAGCDLALRFTRGAVMGIALIEPQTRTLTYAAVGNIRLAILGAHDSGSNGQHLSLANSQGIVGAGFRHLRPKSRSLSPDDLVVLFTDGIPESAPLTYSDKSDLQDLAREIVNTWGRINDDVAVMIYKCGSGA